MKIKAQKRLWLWAPGGGGVAGACEGLMFLNGAFAQFPRQMAEGEGPQRSPGSQGLHNNTALTQAGVDPEAGRSLTGLTARLQPESISHMSFYILTLMH